MRTAQQATIDHIKESGLFEEVSRYAGEAEDSTKLAMHLPAALVVAKDGSYAQRTYHTQHVLVAYRNPGHQQQEEGSLTLVEGLLRYLTDTNAENHIYTDDTYTYQIQVQNSVAASALKITSRWAIYVVSFEVEQWLT